jgi:NADH-quinone oxidoreductase subunit M
MKGFPILTALTLAPLVGGLVVVGLGEAQRRLARGLALAVSLIGLVLTVLLCAGFDSASGSLQFVERQAWIPSLSVEYFLGVDGLGLLMVLLTALVVPMALAASWRRIDDRVPLYHALVLFLQSGLFGTFTALNFFHWFLFWELSLIPAFFLIKLWGGPRRSEAAVQFFIYTLVGSVALLLAFLALFQATGSFDFLRLRELAQNGELMAGVATQLRWSHLSAEQLGLVIFLGALLGFAVKVPLMPFHTWLPLAYAEAPTPVTMLLTGLMSKMGVYGLLRILLPIFPDQMRTVLTPLLGLAVLTIVFSAAAACAQKDLKRTLAYSSINHLGYCLLGIFAVVKAGEASAVDQTAALSGVLLQMFNHGLTAATLFCFVGFLEQRSGGLRGLDDFGGLRKVAPVFTGLMGIALFSSLGLPGLNSFVGEFLIFKGVFGLASWAAAISLLGLLLTALFILTILQRVFSGPLNDKWSAFGDLTVGQRWMVAPAIALMFGLGVWPQLAIGLFNSTVMRLVETLRF